MEQSSHFISVTALVKPFFKGSSAILVKTRRAFIPENLSFGCEHFFTAFTFLLQAQKERRPLDFIQLLHFYVDFPVCLIVNIDITTRWQTQAYNLLVELSTVLWLKYSNCQGPAGK